MRSVRSNFRLMELLLATLMSLPLSAVANEPQPPDASPPSTPQPMSVDVTLTVGGVLRGYVLDAQAAPVANVEVRLTAPDGQQVATRSDDRGRFGYQGLRGGAYQLETEQGVVLCRAWTADAAPPQSAATLLVVHDEQAVRGQWHAPPHVNGVVGRMKRVMTNPFAVAAIIGAAVAIPVAIHNANRDNAS